MFYDSVETLQAEHDAWMTICNEKRTYHGRWCFGKTPMNTLLDSADLTRQKQDPAKSA